MLVLIRQLRPAVNKTVIELPAGLIDKGETPKQAGIRELKEETGFIVSRTLLFSLHFSFNSSTSFFINLHFISF